MTLTSSFDCSPGFTSLLKCLSAEEAIGDRRFPPRNFRLECELPEGRVQQYLARPTLPGAVSDPARAFEELDVHHKGYLWNEVQAGSRIDGFSEKSPDCPDTFRRDCQLTEFGESDEDLFLVRLEEMRFVSTQASWDFEEASHLLRQVAENNRRGSAPAADQIADCKELLTRWQVASDNRPLFAAFWEETADVLTALAPAWADELRDRMGLAHYDAVARLSPIRVVAFRYPINRVAKRSGSDQRLLVRPSVLDGSLNPAFYTGAPGSGVGSTVDLVTREDQPWQEVVHPAVYVRPSDVWAVGEIVTGLVEPLERARSFHSLKVAVGSPNTDFANLCEEVDGDLS